MVNSEYFRNRFSSNFTFHFFSWVLLITNVLESWTDVKNFKVSFIEERTFMETSRYRSFDVNTNEFVNIQRICVASCVSEVLLSLVSCVRRGQADIFDPSGLLSCQKVSRNVYSTETKENIIHRGIRSSPIYDHGPWPPDEAHNLIGIVCYSAALEAHASTL